MYTNRTQMIVLVWVCLYNTRYIYAVFLVSIAHIDSGFKFTQCVRNFLNTIFFPGISVMDKDYELTTNAFTRAKKKKKDNSKFAMTAGFKTFL